MSTHVLQHPCRVQRTLWSWLPSSTFMWVLEMGDGSPDSPSKLLHQLNRLLVTFLFLAAFLFLAPVCQVFSSLSSHLSFLWKWNNCLWFFFVMLTISPCHLRTTPILIWSYEFSLLCDAMQSFSFLWKQFVLKTNRISCLTLQSLMRSVESLW